LITLAMATEIAAPRETVWGAISDPDQECHWRPGVSRRLGDRAASRQRLRHRYRIDLHAVPIVLEEARIATVALEKLRSEVRLGLFRFEETFSLTATGPQRTRLGLKVTAPNRMPVVGGSLDRFDVRRFAADLASVSLQAVRDWCERGEVRERPLPALPGLAEAAGASVPVPPGTSGR